MKNSKIQNGHHFWRVIFLKIRFTTLARYPMGKNFVKIAHMVFKIQAF